jgi:Ca2+-binding RTX toxin-like protein
MAIAYDTQTQLNSLLASGGIDLSVRNAIINSLMIDGYLTSPGDKVAVQDENLPPPIFPPLASSAQVLYLTNPVDTVATDANLKVIVETGDAVLSVTGSNDVFVATGKGPDLVDMRGSSGDNVIMVGSGNQMVLAGAGADSVYGGKGADQFIGGTGDRQLLQAGSGSATLIGGSGDFDTLIGGSGNDHHHGGNPWGDPSFATLGGGDKDDCHGHDKDHDHGKDDHSKGSDHDSGKFDSISGGDLMIAGSGNNQWLLAGSDPATMYGGSGSNDTVQGGSGKDVIYGGSGLNQLLEGGDAADTITAGTGGDTLRGGLGDDLYKIGLVGNDTVQGGGGNDKVQFSNNYNGNATVTTNNGLTTVQFANTGQSIEVSNVKTLVFADHTVHLH